jgi:hypothetical protein
MRLLPGIGYELAGAIRAVNAAVDRSARVDSKVAETWTQLEETVDRHCSAGDADSALAAIERWQRGMLSLLRSQ